MLLRSVTLQDFGLYAGRQIIHLLPRKRDGKSQPVILVGGKNGAGKTSLLEAVRLTLYGKFAIGARVSQVEYEDYLRSRIHRPPKGGGAPTESMVALDFDFAEGGEIHRYQVARSWAARGKSLIESLEITKDGKEITSVPREEWHSFLQELLPPGVSQLFFFDGEKIKDIAEDTADDEHLSAAIKSLLGIELVARLRTDLGLFIARNERRGSGNVTTRLDEIVREAEKLSQEIIEANEALADLLTRHEGQLRAAEKAKQRFVATGGDIAKNRARLQAEAQLLNARRASLLHAFQDGAGGLWPFVLAPKLLSKVLAKSDEANPDTLAKASMSLLKMVETWRSHASPSAKRRWTDQHLADLRVAIQGTVQSHRKKPAVRNTFSAKCREQLEYATQVGAPAAKSFATEYAKLDLRREEIDRSLSRFDETTSDFLFDELRSAEQTVGATSSQIDQLRVKVKELKHQQIVLEREQRNILEQQAEASRSSRQLALASRASKALTQYESQLITQKTRALEQAFVDCFNRLARKEDLVRGVFIDDKSFQATLVDAHGVEVPKNQLSAGERQVYAIAMLWALAKTSGRALPIIIDTPLGRLDSDHRAAIIERYLPEVSHQVVVLSTDTEIDTQIVRSLDSFVSHSYLLEYLPTERRTVPVPGYFGTPRNETRKHRALQQA